MLVVTWSGNLNQNALSILFVGVFFAVGVAPQFARASAAACMHPPLTSTALNLPWALDCVDSLRAVERPLESLIAMQWAQLIASSGQPHSRATTQLSAVPPERATEVGLAALALVEARAEERCTGDVPTKLCPWHSALRDVIDIVSAVASIVVQASAHEPSSFGLNVARVEVKLWTEFVRRADERLRTYAGTLEPHLTEEATGRTADLVAQARELDRAIGWLPKSLNDPQLVIGSASMLLGLITFETAVHAGPGIFPEGISADSSVKGLVQAAQEALRSSAAVLYERGFAVASASALRTSAALALKWSAMEPDGPGTLRDLQSARDRLELARLRSQHEPSLLARVEKTARAVDIREALVRSVVPDDRSAALERLLLRLVRSADFRDFEWLRWTSALLTRYYNWRGCRGDGEFDLSAVSDALLRLLDAAVQSNAVGEDDITSTDAAQWAMNLAGLLDSLRAITTACVADGGLRVSILNQIGDGAVQTETRRRGRFKTTTEATGLYRAVAEILAAQGATRATAAAELSARGGDGPPQFPDALALRLQLVEGDLRGMSQIGQAPEADRAILVNHAARPAVASTLARCGILVEFQRPRCNIGSGGDLNDRYRRMIAAYSDLLLDAGMPDAKIELCGFARSVGIDCADERGQSMFASPSWRLLIDPASPFWKSLTERGWHPELEAAPDSPSLVRVRVEAVNYLLRQAVSNPPLAAAVAEITLPRGAYAVRLVTADGQTALASSGIVLRIDGSVDPIDSQFALPKGDLSQIALDLLPEMPGAPRFSPRPYWVTSDRDALR
jgi:hypothetical protein